MNARDQLPWKRVWVTGAGKGIGRAISLAFCEAGVTVYASARSQSDLLNLQKACKSFKGEIICCPLDITDLASIEKLFTSWKSEQLLPEAAILNAGTHDPFSAHDFSAARCKNLLEVNLQGTINCLEPLLREYMALNRGHVAVMASVAGYSGLPTASAYGASKAALINLTEALKLDLKDTGIKVQLISPGFVRTPLTDKNTFTMPALMEPEEAAYRVIDGLLTSRFEITFPRRFTFILKFLRILPYSLYFKLVGYSVKT